MRTSRLEEAGFPGPRPPNVPTLQNVRGIGETTGISYRATGVEGDHNHTMSGGEPYSDTFTYNLRFSPVGPGETYVIREHSHFQINANGEMTVSRFVWDVECR